ncbi:hypothetical protein [Hymenobacter jejuensis]|uniref:Uncharacterized protein n=1 Tax=Hymenobacter jejuensis TaxID=2502781 RepID=A0A5B7ZVY8_9BACT|nr:hypothetical protein [Hymenobacter jejuensis]QDA58979.1 hypothetical protein FHG12_02160 [Hymenobacter jejuensis]
MTSSTAYFEGDFAAFSAVLSGFIGFGVAGAPQLSASWGGLRNDQVRVGKYNLTSYLPRYFLGCTLMRMLQAPIFKTIGRAALTAIAFYYTFVFINLGTIWIFDRGIVIELGLVFVYLLVIFWSNGQIASFFKKRA